MECNPVMLGEGTNTLVLVDPSCYLDQSVLAMQVMIVIKPLILQSEKIEPPPFLPLVQRY